jgi:thiamine biosynthesis lipoprotein ApbE
MPENRYLSVSVQTSHSGVADALSTAIFNMDEAEAESFVKSFEENIEVTLVFPDGSVKVLKS